ncbi:radical SAM protein [Marichromatium sp. AB31]|uniref:B12-binding domain-containing radical SAM protein n=1 Tax=Marichromatium sp. AB31 TaxID=2483362 RepID=UPI000F3E3793|nr:radical SAM protein [Marichromatium sp. AB31]RNE88439.1 radical SAM protein [Marichromatium sp. AB31]
MRVLLIQAFLGGNEPLVFPIGLGSLAANLVGHQVRVLDTNLVESPRAALAEALAEFAPEAIGISLRNIDSTNKREVVFYYPLLGELLEVIERHARAPVIIGGSGFSMFAREIMEAEPRLDLGVHLEGEETLQLLLERLDRPETVPSVFYRRDGALHFSGPLQGPVDLDAIALPERGALRVGDYRAGFVDAIGVETKRGCPLSCVYCIYGYLNGKRMRLRDPRLIVDEIEALVRDHGVERFTFVDSVFNLPRAHAERICRELIARGVRARWSAWINERHADAAFMALAVRAGCVHAIFSPDAIADPTLRRLGKDMRRADILRIYRLLSRHPGLEVSYNFFRNPPGQTLGNLLSILFFVLRARLRLGRRVHFEFSVLRIEPHTGLHRIALEEGVVDPDDPLLYPRYYTNPRTRHLDRAFDVLLWLKGRIGRLRARRAAAASSPTEEGA